VMPLNLEALSKRYNVDLPPNFKGITSPEQLAAFLATDSGKNLITQGRNFFNQLSDQYNLSRSTSNYHPSTGDLTDAAVADLPNKLSLMDALYLGMALERYSGTDSSFSKNAANSLMQTIVIISQRDPYLVGPFLLDVMPAILDVTQDEMTLISAMSAFTANVVARYDNGQSSWAYSNVINRRYFLGVFADIGANLRKATSDFDHNRLEDELRLVPEPRLDMNYKLPYLYQPKPGFWQTTGFEPMPTNYGQIPQPLDLYPRATMPTQARQPVGTGIAFTPGADTTYSYMSDQVREPGPKMFRQRVSNRFRIGAIGASTLLRRISESFGPMPADYSGYWLNTVGEAGGFFGRTSSGSTTTDTGGIAAFLGQRSISGGHREAVMYTDSNATTLAGTSGGPSSSTSTRQYTVDAQANAMKVPFSGILPFLAEDENVGITRGIGNIHREYAGTTVTQNTPGAPSTSTEQKTRGYTKGLLDTYSRIAKENATDMLVYVAGEHYDELTNQPSQGRLDSRLVFITKEGNMYQLDYGSDTQAELMNFLYFGANTRQFLSSIKTIGSSMLTKDSAAGGLSGTAVGFTLPTGGGETYSALAFGNLARDVQAMTPYAAQQAVGNAVTHLLQDRKQKDVYAAFFRGNEVVKTDPTDNTHISDSAFSGGVGEVLWRRMRTREGPLADQFEFRAAGGAMRTPVFSTSGGNWSPVVGVKGAWEWKPTKYLTKSVGATVSYSDINLMDNYMMASAQADQMYSRIKTTLVNFYHWSEDEARNTGLLISATYMYGKLEDWTQRNADGTYTIGQRKDAQGNPINTPSPHYGSLLFMYM